MSKKIALISYHTDPFSSLGGDTSGGMNVYVRELTKSFSKLGHKIDVFTRSDKIRSEKNKPLDGNSRIIRILAGPEKKIDKNKLSNYTTKFTEQIFSFTNKEKHKYDLVISHYWLSGIIGKKLSERWKIPLIIRFHTLGQQKKDILNNFSFYENKNRIKTEKKLCEFSHAIVVSSKNEKRAIIKEYLIDTNKIHIIPCGVNLDFFKPKKNTKINLGLQKNTKYFLTVGRIDPVKGLDLFIHSLSFLKRLNPQLKFHALHIGGEVKKKNKACNLKSLDSGDFQSTSQKKEVKRILNLSKKFHLSDHFSFIGSKSHEELSLWYSAVDILAIPSRYETFCLVALEAASCGLPTIGYKVGGMSESIEENFTGILVPERRTSEFALALNNLVADIKFSKKLGKFGRKRAQTFSWEKTAKSEIKVWEALTV
ncbi:MAG: glycosyltransferase [Nitrospinota bacterium]|nr:glycosyltransferase [Nitrospinota bacterium]